MNKNVESHFARSPHIDIQRSQFDMSSGHIFSGNAGECIPFYCKEILPGDSFKVTTSKVIRLQTLLKPILGEVYLDTMWFFVPNRLVWEHWNEFCGESKDAWMPDVEYSIPQIRIPDDGFGVGSLADHLGIDPNIKSDGLDEAHEVSALPFRAYAKIMSDWFRSEVVSDAPVIPFTDATVDGNDTSADDVYCAYGGPLYHAAKFHDMFTSALIAPQCGPPVTIPVGTTPSALLPVYALRTLDDDNNNTRYQVPYKTFDAYFPGDLHCSGAVTDGAWTPVSTGDTNYSTVKIHSRSNEPSNLYGDLIHGSGSSAGAMKAPNGMMPDNLWCDFPGVEGGSISINSLRTAFAVQRFYEAYARSGRRYTEIIESMFSVSSPDARLQRSEYLGGNRVPVAIHEVSQNSPGENSFLGDVAAMSHTSDVHQDFIKSFTEHGYLFGIAVLRYTHNYSQGVEPMWTRKNIFDFYWPSFAHLSETPVYKRQLFVDNTKPLQDDDGVFGYQEIYADYRFSQNSVSGEMRPDVSNSLAIWHLGDDYDTQPTLSDAWMREDPANLDRCLAVSSTVSNQYFADIYTQCIATRPMPMFGVPGLSSI